MNIQKKGNCAFRYKISTHCDKDQNISRKISRIALATIVRKAFFLDF